MTSVYEISLNCQRPIGKNLIFWLFIHVEQICHELRYIVLPFYDITKSSPSSQDLEENYYDMNRF